MHTLDYRSSDMLLALTAALILEGAVTYAFVLASAGSLILLPLAILRWLGAKSQAAKPEDDEKSPFR